MVGWGNWNLDEGGELGGSRSKDPRLCYLGAVLQELGRGSGGTCWMSAVRRDLIENHVQCESKPNQEKITVSSEVFTFIKYPGTGTYTSFMNLFAQRQARTVGLSLSFLLQPCLRCSQLVCVCRATSVLLGGAGSLAKKALWCCHSKEIKVKQAVQHLGGSSQNDDE